MAISASFLIQFTCALVQLVTTQPSPDVVEKYPYDHSSHRRDLPSGSAGDVTI
jgi:hypothetical protein